MMPIADLASNLSVLIAKCTIISSALAEGRSFWLTLVPLAIGADLVRIEFQQILDGLLVLGRLIGSSASRHSEVREECGVGRV